MKKFGLLLTLSAWGLSAHASFDLVLVADTVRDSIRRFDGDSGAYLGEFGKGFFSTPDQLVVRPSTGEVYVTDQSRQTVSVWNYSTGKFLREWQLSGGFSGGATGIALEPSGNLLTFAEGQISRFSTSGTLLASFNPSTLGSLYSLTVDPSGNIMAFDASGTYASYTSAFSLRTGPTVVSAGIYGNGYFANSTTLMVPSYTLNGIQRYTVSATGVLIANGLFGTTVLDLPLGVAPGHTTDFYAAARLATDGTKDSLHRFSRLSTTLAPQTLYTEASTGTRYRGMATVLAPEPGTMLAIGSGVAALILRKRKKS